MPISGFRVGDRVLTPADRLATVVAVVSGKHPQTLRVRYDAVIRFDPGPDARVHGELRGSALRLVKRS